MKVTIVSNLNVTAVALIGVLKCLCLTLIDSRHIRGVGTIGDYAFQYSALSALNFHGYQVVERVNISVLMLSIMAQQFIENCYNMYVRYYYTMPHYCLHHRRAVGSIGDSAFYGAALATLTFPG